MQLLTGVRAGVAVAAMIGAAGLAASGGKPLEIAISGRSSTNPSIAASGPFVALAFGSTAANGPTDLFVAVSADAGRTFRPPVRVNDVVGDVRLSGEQPPRVSLIARADGLAPSIVVVWTSKGRDGTRLLQARSDDGGKSYSGATVLPGGDAAGNRGWESTATDRDGHVIAVWLDHREAASGAAAAAPMHHEGQEHTGHAPVADGATRAQLSKLYFSRLDGVGGAHPLAAGVCYCCKTAVAAGPDGSIYAAWRHVYPGNVRDIAFTVSRDNGRTFAPPVRVSDDRWVLDGCPENGPTLAVDRDNRVHIVWPTLVSGPAAGSEPTLALFYAAGDGRRFSPRERIPTEGLPRHPQITIDARGSLVATWDEQANGTRRVVMGRAVVNARGPIRFTREIVDERSAVYPVVAAAGDGIVQAWTAGPPDAAVIRSRRVP
jgi:hypothetical protein